MGFPLEWKQRSCDCKKAKFKNSILKNSHSKNSAPFVVRGKKVASEETAYTIIFSFAFMGHQ